MNNEVKFTLRLEEEVYEELKEIADMQKRSLNKQIEYILREYIEKLAKNENEPYGTKKDLK